MILILARFEIDEESTPEVMAVLGTAIAASMLGEYEYSLEPRGEEDA